MPGLQPGLVARHAKVIHLTARWAPWLILAFSRRITCALTPASSGVSACQGLVMAQQQTTSEQGYGWVHQQERARWVRYQQAGGDDPDPRGPHRGELLCRAGAECKRPNGTQWIGRHEAWDLGHHPGQRGWRGPEHVKCNRSAGARASNRTGNPGARNPKRGRRARRGLVEVSVDPADL